MSSSRREFLIVSGGTVAATALNLAVPFPSRANPLGLPIGLELYTVNAELDKDYEGTLKKIAEVGYTEIEAGVSPKRSAADAKKSFDAAGLKCHSIHIGMGGIEEAIPYAKELGAKYVISSVTFPTTPKPGPDGKIDMKALFAQLSSFTLDDYKLIAARCNDMGKTAKAAGLQFGYHNHNFEFKPQPGGGYGYDVILKNTNPELVTFELDCGWMAAAGHDPAEYLTKHSNRYTPAPHQRLPSDIRAVHRPQPRRSPQARRTRSRPHRLQAHLRRREKSQNRVLLRRAGAAFHHHSGSRSHQNRLRLSPRHGVRKIRR